MPLVFYIWMADGSELSIGPTVPEIQGLYVTGDWVSHGESLADAAIFLLLYGVNRTVIRNLCYLN
jgi:hypothetical protein